MSIFNRAKQPSSITQAWRALKLFTDTDRYEFIRLFLSYLNDDPPRERILFLHGAGGIGKSLLLRYLKENHCKRLRLRDWERARTLKDEQLMDAVSSARPDGAVPSAYLDFGMPPHGENRPQEAFAALLMLRRSLAGYRLRFPLYDFATVWYLSRTGRMTPERLKSLFPPEELDFISTLFDFVSSTAWGAISKGVINLLTKQMSVDEHFTFYLQKRGLTKDQVEEIQRLDPDRELIFQLPRLFAEDLNAAIDMPKAPRRVALFFDTHEAFWRQEHNDLPEVLYFERDQWLRLLVGSLNLSAGIVVVVAGQVPPKWEAATHVRIPTEYLDLYSLGDLPGNNAGNT